MYETIAAEKLLNFSSVVVVRTQTICVCIFLGEFKCVFSPQIQAKLQQIQGDSVARGPKLLSIKNYVIEIMT